MNRIAFGLATLAVALTLVFLPPSFINAQEPTCSPTVSEVIDQIIANGGRLIALQRVEAEEFTHILVVESGGIVAMGLVRFDCIVTPPVHLGTAAQVVEH